MLYYFFLFCIYKFIHKKEKYAFLLQIINENYLNFN